MNIEPILLTTVRVQTYQGGRHLTNATGFFFERDERLFWSAACMSSSTR
jgi:hypothetical protein